MGLKGLNDLYLLPQDTLSYLTSLRNKNPLSPIKAAFESIKGVKVLVLGENITDEYIFCETMGKANKEPILAAKYLKEERYEGGAAAVANQIFEFTNDVHLFCQNTEPIRKSRFLEDYMEVKLFEIYSRGNIPTSKEEESETLEKLELALPHVDVVIVADYGHGFITDKMKRLLCEKAPFLCVNAQTNAGNRGFNLISAYSRADFISIDESEARLECRKESLSPEKMAEEIAKKISCPALMITLGKNGCKFFETKNGNSFHSPAFSVKITDRMGAGDAVFALTSLAVYKNTPLFLLPFLGSVIGALSCGIIGNKRPVRSEDILKFIAALVYTG